MNLSRRSFLGGLLATTALVTVPLAELVARPVVSSWLTDTDAWFLPGNVLWVDSDTGSYSEGSFDVPFKTLEAALRTANKGDVIMIKSGHFEQFATDRAT